MLKEFFKNMSIYGILPVMGKFLSFLLVPLYAKMFSVEEFGMIDVIDVLVFFLLLLTSFEIPTALGRYFYDSPDMKYKQAIVSTGLYLTLITTSLFTFLTLIFEEQILTYYIGIYQYRSLFRLSLIWLFISSINTYLSFIPRYDNKPKQYVIVSLISISIKLVSAVLFVAVFEMGLEGVFWGYICGSSLSSLIYLFIARKLIILRFSMILAKKAIAYSFPLMFGVLAMGMWAPLSRYFMLTFFPVAIIGYYSFSSRIISVNSIIHTSLGIAWNPMLFENKNILTQTDYIKRISGIMAFLSFSFGITLTLFSPEITFFIGKREFLEGIAFTGLLALATTIKALTNLRGFAPYLTDQTHVVSISNILSLITCCLIMILLKDKMGIIGIGLVMILYEAINYIILTFYTYKKYPISMHNSYEIGLIGLLFLAELAIIYVQPLVVRIVLFLLLSLYTFYVLKLTGGIEKIREMAKYYVAKKNK